MDEFLLCSNCGYEVDEVATNGMCPTCWDAWDKGRLEERFNLLNQLTKELDSLKKYGRTELWGLHKAIYIVKGETNE